MRWKITIYKDGDLRIRRAFLLAPMRIGDEYRWLEMASWEEVRKKTMQGYRWKPGRWTSP
jgi:hypothetical protein